MIKEHIRSLFFSLGSLYRARAATVFTLILLAMALTLPTSLYVLLQNAKTATADWHQGKQIQLFLKQISQNEVDSVVSKLKIRLDISKVHYISPDEGLKDLEKQTGFSDALYQLGDNPLPGVIEIQPSMRIQTMNQLQKLQAALDSLPQVESSSIDQEWITRLQNFMNLVNQFIHILFIVFGLGIIFTVAHTMSVTVQDRRKEIQVFKLIGATNPFIRRPFLYTGLLYGLLSALLAWFFVSIILLNLKTPMRELINLYDPSTSFSLKSLSLREFGMLILGNSMLGLFSSWYAVQREIAEIDITE